MPRLTSLVLLALPVLALAQCDTPSTLPSFTNDNLPDPFLFPDGRRTATVNDWQCRRSQLAALIQGYEAGSIPGKPTTVTGSFTKNGNSGSLTVTASQNGKSVNWANSISYPSGTPPAGGWPLLIALGGGSIPVPAGIATLNYNNDNIAQQSSTSSRGTGLFYNLYGNTATASAMSAWTWGVSRIIDALETTPAASINTERIAVTGCSRNGKGALMIGAFETRIALTIPQESGSGGDACWRLSKFEESSGSKVQTATQIVTENVWFSSGFNSYVNQLSKLPYDHHSLVALVAPRGLVSFENTDFIWLSPMSNWGCVSAGRTVYRALGVPQNHGFAQVGGHNHCAWPSSLTPTLNAFFDKFLFGKNVNTDFFSTNNVFGPAKWDANRWMNWSVPTLSGTASPTGSTTSAPVTTPPPTTTAPGTTTTPTTTTTANSPAQTLYGQCGGIGWTGPTACASPARCAYSNDWYSQCLP
ncbi:carbohydrate-binding module family 1 protein [Botryobasidium botryosum FD-172 SS1]|uniref:(4-O-methyl)-D-glucuronate--lignin esterase n=1 Tax=Botryobasidium botryosum (strain FD-172 SS1) TaxID=930990 RepID=A0A067M8Q8_BOTB1|nr:carbohydrate-binding module family 1 protein [Botryobasidium botryosum FD-172 SS1]